MPDVIYPPGFYASQKDGSFRAASVVVPIVLNLLQPESVVDVGCGVGPWAAAFMKAGVTDTLGVDGDYVDRSQLMIPPENFHPLDLSSVDGATSFRRFDLAISLEVAEHLDKSRAKHFVEFLTGLAPVIMFGAAVPGQGGRHHVNEQWPSYWVNLFDEAGYEAVDALRSRIWGMQDVPFWYQQNTLLFFRKNVLLHTSERRYVPHLVHPVLYQKYRSELTEARARIRALEAELSALKR